MRILLDTNILISALLSRERPPGQILAAVKQDGLVLVSSDYQCREFLDVVGRKHLRDRIPREDAEDLVHNLAAVGVIVTEPPALDLSPDPKDNPILAAAIAGKADLIVSGDKSHMLALGEVNGIPIVSARDALQRLKR